MVTKVKICGITSLPDALAAVEAGADALGFMFFPLSPRYVSYEQAAAIIRALPPFVAKVGVFVNPTADEVRHAIAGCGFDTLQFHGDETPDFCRQFGLKVLKAFRMRDEESLTALPAFAEEAWLLDSHIAGQPGGTGRRFNWDLAVAATKLGRPVILAGGLTPENAAEAVRLVRPYALDVSSGVESTPGRKDAGKVHAFIAAAKAVLAK
jgi:phosphoribosylanthranilate isomerase